MTNTSFLDTLTIDEDGIYSYDFHNTEQLAEIAVRDNFNTHVDKDVLNLLSRHHSIPVMDREVEKFIQLVPIDGTIIDVGGCWGWHWRNIHSQRPDIKVYIVDFIKSNLYHAKTLLNDDVNKNIFLIHGDATDLKFPDETFNGYWSVQTFQHIPNMNLAISESNRVLKKGGAFACYFLNNTGLIKLLYKILNKPYLKKGYQDNGFYLIRACHEIETMLQETFGRKIYKRFSEILFNPTLKTSFAGAPTSWAGQIDRCLSGSFPLLSFVARQCSYHTTK